MRSNPGASVHADTAVNRDSHLRRLLTPTPLFDLAGPCSTRRAQAESLVAEKFAASWQARVSLFMPWLLSMHCLGRCTAVAGLRPAGNAPLFLEQYLAEPAEALVSRAADTEVSRSMLVEIGNLAASQRGASHLLFLVMTVALHQAGYRWIVFTATHALRNTLGKLGFPIHKLANANADHLDDATRAEWGRYYASEPQVMAGNLDMVMQLIDERLFLQRLASLYRHTIDSVATTLRSSSLEHPRPVELQ